MKISDIFTLNKKQFELDFIDIDPLKELPLFLDAYIFLSKNDEWSTKCNLIISDFFRNIHEAVEGDNQEKLRKLCCHLTEPNETCLGRSRGKPKGAFQSNDKMIDVFKQLFKVKDNDKKQFNAIQDLSDMKFYIDGVGNDTISDIVTNLIRRQLLIYTKQQCDLYGIPTEKRKSKPYWNEISSQWEIDESIDQLIIDDERILLVPKNIVFVESKYLFTKQQFVQHDLLDFLKEEELKLPNSSLIKYRVPRKDQEIGDPYVTKKSLKEKYKVEKKEKVLEFSSKYPKLMDNFKEKCHFECLSIFDFYELEEDSITDEEYDLFIDGFISTLKKIPTGAKYADEYHSFILGLLTFLFHPTLTNPKKETPIDNSRKRIDITYVNASEKGFFYNLKNEITSNYIYVECKNYAKNIENPEIDQLAGRFNVSQSKVGILVCRKTDKYAIERVSGQFRRQNELIMILTDDVLIAMLESMKLGNNKTDNSLWSHESFLYDLKREIELEKY